MFVYAYDSQYPSLLAIIWQCVIVPPLSRYRSTYLSVPVTVPFHLVIEVTSCDNSIFKEEQKARFFRETKDTFQKI